MASIITMEQSQDATHFSVRLREIVHILKDATSGSVPLYDATKKALVEIAIGRAETLADEFDEKTTKVGTERVKRKYTRKPKAAEETAEAEPPK